MSVSVAIMPGCWDKVYRSIVKVRKFVVAQLLKGVDTAAVVSVLGSLCLHVSDKLKRASEESCQELCCAKFCVSYSPRLGVGVND